jgi:hypothetical protein
MRGLAPGLDDNDLGSPRQWAFLASKLQGIDIVSLPEPIHMTHEFPVVRFGIIEFLNEHMGFHVLGRVVFLALTYGAITFQQSGVFGVCLDIGGGAPGRWWA